MSRRDVAREALGFLGFLVVLGCVGGFWFLAFFILGVGR